MSNVRPQSIQRSAQPRQVFDVHVAFFHYPLDGLNQRLVAF